MKLALALTVFLAITLPATALGQQQEAAFAIDAPLGTKYYNIFEGERKVGCMVSNLEKIEHEWNPAYSISEIGVLMMLGVDGRTSKMKYAEKAVFSTDH